MTKNTEAVFDFTYIRHFYNARDIAYHQYRGHQSSSRLIFPAVTTTFAAGFMKRREPSALTSHEITDISWLPFRNACRRRFWRTPAMMARAMSACRSSMRCASLRRFSIAGPQRFRMVMSSTRQSKFLPRRYYARGGEMAIAWDDTVGVISFAPLSP